MTVQIIHGDCREVMAGMPDESVHCVVTSPPYWRQRDYGIDGQIGLETTPEEYVDQLRAVFNEARRVLRDDGTLWLNIGDKWASGGHGGGGSFMEQRSEAWAHAKDAKGWRDKELVMVHALVADALRSDGWLLRQCNIWGKPNGMPESVSDRTTAGHEYVLHFSKRGDYWYDAEAVATVPKASTETRLAQDIGGQAGSRRANGGEKTNGPMKAVARKSDKQRGHSRRHDGFNDRWDQMERDEQMARPANLRSVWWISPAQYQEGHYAVMPDKLAAICIMAGCPKGGAVLDPFGGAGTTGLVAERLGRDSILIELNQEYADMARARIRADLGTVQTELPESHDVGPLFEATA